MKYNETQLQALLADARFVDIGNLPSNFYPYTYGKLFIRPFTLKELMLVSRSVVEKDITHLIRAVDVCITEDVKDLTIGDFYYILLWLKTYSSPKQPKIVSWDCNETLFVDKETGEGIPNDNFVIPEGKSVDDYNQVDCGTANSEIIHMSTVEIVQLPEEEWEGLPEGFDFPRVGILPEIYEIRGDAVRNAELNFIIPSAQWIKGNTFKEKLSILEAQPDLNMFEEAKAIDDTVVHGIKEQCILKCRRCRAESQYIVTLDALSFFQ